VAAPCFERLSSLLTAKGIAHLVRHHAPVYTSEEAAQVRGTTLASGAKALICKADERFVMIVLPADHKLASKLARKTLGIKGLRFASREEVEQLTGLTPGSIPPFGSLFDLPIWCDEKLAAEEQINFNAGDHSISISMTFADYLAAERPRMGSLAE
jgi:Ala-tRNA(Pro) deacylase